ncbi:Alpha/Beta hydrolase protein [Mycotypha africana]|uniref:Alpha/Beta hydrolase protein n=1 Tax=Mycotypha africana TaxID=64632 RepID=UPI002300CA8B|nr:Alpha/Beta hydrolase protein [Mycotypha africana]KAI8979355.1 Alpha/Beta hydrolase protein [Mycotypha africana]
MNKIIQPQLSKSTPYTCTSTRSQCNNISPPAGLTTRPALIPTPPNFPTPFDTDNKMARSQYYSSETTTASTSPPTVHGAPPNRKLNGVKPLNVLRESRLHQTLHIRTTTHLNNSVIRNKSCKVGYAVYGSHDGIPVFVIGGYGCTRLVGIMFEELALRYGLKLIWPERPGYGLSDEYSSQRFKALDWADTVIQLANEMEIKQFCILAQSVGSVFALAIAYKYPERVLGPVYLISPWVSTQAANTFKWTRRLPSPIVHKLISLALDVMGIWNRNGSHHSEDGPRHASASTYNSSFAYIPPHSSHDDSSYSSHPLPPHTNRRLRFEQPKRQRRTTVVALEEDELLASFDEEVLDLPTDFPTNRPLRHFVRPKNMSLYLAMNKQRTSENYNAGQLCDAMIALEKYHSFGFSYSDVKVPVSAVWGDMDTLIPQRAINSLANSLPDLRLKILEGEAHDLVWKEGVMEWAMRGISERWKEKSEKIKQ